MDVIVFRLIEETEWYKELKNSLLEIWTDENSVPLATQFSATSIVEKYLPLFGNSLREVLKSIERIEPFVSQFLCDVIQSPRMI